MDNSDVSAIILELMLSRRADRFDATYQQGYLQALNDLLEVFEPESMLKEDAINSLGLKQPA